MKNVLPKRQGYNYMQEAATWLKQHNTNQESVFYNESRMRFYTNEPFAGTWSDNELVVSDAISNKSIQNYTYLVISQSYIKLDKNALIISELQNYTEIKRFDSFKAKNSIVIYRKNTH